MPDATRITVKVGGRHSLRRSYMYNLMMTCPVGTRAVRVYIQSNSLTVVHISELLWTYSHFDVSIPHTLIVGGRLYAPANKQQVYSEASF